MRGTPVFVRLDKQGLAKLDRFVGRLQGSSRQKAIRLLIDRCAKAGAEQRPKLQMPIGAKERRLYQLCVDRRLISVGRDAELWEMGLAAGIKTRQSQELAMACLAAQGFARWEPDEGYWSIRRRWEEPSATGGEAEASTVPRPPSGEASPSPSIGGGQGPAEAGPRPSSQGARKVLAWLLKRRGR